MRVESYISLTVGNNTISLLAKNEKEAKELLELLKRFGIETSIVVASRCG